MLRIRSSFRLIAKAIRSAHPHGIVIFRTNVVGHKNCEKYTSPETPFPPHEEEANMPFNWKSFGEMNDVMVESIKEFFPDNLYVLDVSMFQRRADGHYLNTKDCLHYAVPGAIDEWNMLLFHLLAQIFGEVKEVGGGMA